MFYVEVFLIDLVSDTEPKKYLCTLKGLSMIQYLIYLIIHIRKLLYNRIKPEIKHVITNIKVFHKRVTLLCMVEVDVMTLP